MNSMAFLTRALALPLGGCTPHHGPAIPTVPWEDKQGQWIPHHNPLHETGRNALQFKATAVTLTPRLLSCKSITSNRKNQQTPWLMDAVSTKRVSQQWEHPPQLNYYESIHLLIIRNFLSILKGNSANFSILSGIKRKSLVSFRSTAKGPIPLTIFIGACLLSKLWGFGSGSQKESFCLF